MGFADWFAMRAPMPDLSCPDCGHQEFVIARDIVRMDASGNRRVCGAVVRCARCVSEFAATGTGVYQPKPAPRAPEAPPPARPTPVDRMLSDPDIPWDGRRKR